MGPYRVIQVDSSSLGGDQTSILPWRRRLVRLDVLKLYRGEDVVRQEPEDIDPDRWLDEREFTELPEANLRGRERIYMKPLSGQRNPETSVKPALNIQVIPEDPEDPAKEGIHERIQAEIHQGN